VTLDLVSVIIPAWQAERYVAQAIDSALGQTYRPIEIIVVDDGSTDGTRSIVERYGTAVRYLYQANTGIGGARNSGVKASTGEFLGFLDADDLWIEDKLAWQTEALRTNPELDMIFGHVQQFPSPELADEVRSRLRFMAEPAPAYLAGTMLIRREAFLRVSSFDSQLQVAEFVDWYLKAIDSGLRSAMEAKLVLRRRLHDSNQGIRKKDARLDYVRAVRAALDRRRTKAGNADAGAV
jgi:glycosyltransferase involved in cell wall biosynthesis